MLAQQPVCKTGYIRRETCIKWFLPLSLVSWMSAERDSFLRIIILLFSLLILLLLKAGCRRVKQSSHPNLNEERVNYTSYLLRPIF